MTRIDQYRTNPSKAVSNFKGRWDSTFAWPSTAISTWLNGGLFGGAEKWSVVSSEADETATNGDLTSYVFTTIGDIVVTAGYVDIFVMGGGGGGGGAAGKAGGGGGAGAVLEIEDVYMEAGTWEVRVAGGGSDSYIRGPDSSSINDPLRDDRMDSHADTRSDNAVSAGYGGNGVAGDGVAGGGDHAQTTSQKGSGSGGGSGNSVGGGGSLAGAAGGSGDLGNNGAVGGNGGGGYYWGGGGGGRGGTPTTNTHYSSAYTDGGAGYATTYKSAGASNFYVAGGGSGVLYKSGLTSSGFTNPDKSDDSNIVNYAGWSGYNSHSAQMNGTANRGSGGGGGYGVSGSGGSGMIIFQTRAEDA